MASLVLATASACTQIVGALSVKEHVSYEELQFHQRFNLVSRHGDVARALLPSTANSDSHHLLCHRDEVMNKKVIPHRNSQIIDRRSVVRTLWIKNKEYSLFSILLRSDLVQRSIRSTPDSMKLRLYEHVRPLPKLPTVNNAAPVARHFRRDVSETLTGNRVRRRNHI